MNQSESKLYSVGVISGALFFCLVISLGVYLISVPFIYGAWHCPSGDCSTPTWVNAVILLLLSSPLLIFTIGSYLCRNSIRNLAANRFLRALLFAAFALFPLCLLIAFAVSAVNSID